MPPTAAWILLARVLRPQGRKGEVLADLFTDNPSQLKEYSQIWLAPPEFTSGPEPSASSVPVRTELRAFWLPTGRNAGRIAIETAADSVVETWARNRTRRAADRNVP